MTPPTPVPDTTGAPPAGTREDRLLKPLDRDACLALLATTAVGRLVFTSRALPEVLPVNFRLDGESVVVRVSDTSRAVEGALNAVVAFEADDIDIGTRTGWSVLVVGHTSEILDAEERARIAALPLIAWAGGDRDRFVRIELERVTGRSLAAADDGHLAHAAEPEGIIPRLP